jgi:YVTN family beta-propeller protein
MPLHILRNSPRLRLATLLTLITVATSFSLCAQVPEPQVGIINRDAAVYNQATGKIYILDATHNAVSVISSDNAATSVKVGSGPVSIGANNVTGMVYVVNNSERSVSVLDGKTDTVVATVPTPARSYAVAVDEVGNKVYISNIFSNMVTVIDGATNTATNVPAGGADGVIVDNDRKRVYLLHYEDTIVAELDPATGAVTKIPTGALHEWGFLRAGNTLYVGHVQDADVAAIDLETHAIRKLPTGSMPCALAYDANKAQLYVASYASGTVTVFDKETVAATIKVPAHPQAVALDAEKALLYVASPQQNAVAVIDLKARRVLRTITTVDRPYALAINPTTHAVYTANLGNAPFTLLGKQ